jgi:hypothetical protein
MKKKIFSSPDVLIVALALVFFALLVVFYFWAIGAIVTQVSRSLAPPVSESFSGFNIEGASKLDLRDLTGQPSLHPTGSTSSATSSQP